MPPECLSRMANSAHLGELWFVDFLLAEELPLLKELTRVNMVNRISNRLFRRYLPGFIGEPIHYQTYRMFDRWVAGLIARDHFDAVIAYENSAVYYESVGFDMLERGHWRAPPSTVLQAELLASMSRSRAVPAVPSWDISVAVAVPLIRVCRHNLSASGTGSMESLPHHAASSPWRWRSR
jgi:hypothetical protein